MNKKIILALVGFAIIGVIMLRKQTAASDQVLNLYIWSNYIDPQVLAQFKQETGITVMEENFSSNEEVEGKLKAGAAGYDVITPSDYMIQRLAQAQLIRRLDTTKIPNMRNLATIFQRPSYDPEGSYCVPYMWGTTGIAYNRKALGFDITSWKELFDPALMAKANKRISLLDDAREVIGAALKVQSDSINSTDAAKLASAKERILKIFPHIGRLDSNSYKDLLATGDIWIAQGYSGDIMRLKNTTDNKDIEFVIPAEGGTIWADNLVIPTNAPHAEAAYKFINFIMRPEINAKIANAIHYATTNESARAFVEPSLLNNLNIYPSEPMRRRLEWITDVGEAAETFDNIWTEIKSTNPNIMIGVGKEESSGG